MTATIARTDSTAAKAYILPGVSEIAMMREYKSNDGMNLSMKMADTLSLKLAAYKNIMMTLLEQNM